VNSRRGARQSGRRARYLGGASLVAACAAFLAIPGGASATAPTCSGKLTLDRNGDAGKYGVDYSFGCKVPTIQNDKADIQAMGLVASRRLDYFQPDPTVFQPNGDPSASDALNCEGPIPGPGFGCPGAMTAGNHVVGQIATLGSSPCRHLERRGAGNVVIPAVQAWVTVTFQDHKNDLDPNTPPTYYTSQSHPYNLGKPRGCPANKRLRAHRRHHRAHHRAHRRHS